VLITPLDIRLGYGSRQDNHPNALQYRALLEFRHPPRPSFLGRFRSSKIRFARRALAQFPSRLRKAHASEVRQETSPAPSMVRTAAAKASCTIRFMETSSSSISRLGAEALGQTQRRKVARGGSKACAVVQEGSYSLYRLDAGSNSAHRPVSNKLR
jgi:hypothetical protein